MIRLGLNARVLFLSRVGRPDFIAVKICQHSAMRYCEGFIDLFCFCNHGETELRVLYYDQDFLPPR